MKRTRKQIGSLLLAVCMVFTMLPTVAFADSTSQIISFEALADDVDFQEVKSGTTVDGLNLPRALTATVTTGSAYTATVSDWVSVPLYDGNTTGNYTFTPTLNLPSDVTLADGVTPPTITVNVLDFVPVTGSLNIGFDPADSTSSIVSDLRYDASGTNWSWDASANTLTLTGDIGGNGAIDFDVTGDIIVTVNGDVSATVLNYFESSVEGSPGKLNINGSGTLTLTNTYSNENAISAEGGLEIADITVNASTVGNNSNVVAVGTGDFTMESGTLNLSATGNNSSGIYCHDGSSILISGTAQVKTNPSVVNYGLYVSSGKNIEISGGTVDVTSTNGSGIIASGEVCISGGIVIAKSTHNSGAVCGVTDGVTVSGGTLVTGTVGASLVNGNVGSDITVSGDNTQVTVNGSVVNSSDLTVSGGNVTVSSTVQGSQNLNGGTVYVNGVQVYPSAFTYAVTVNNGTANPSTVSAGATVTITANTPDDGKRFKEWTVVNGGVTLANAKASSTIFTMPANAVEVTATYENIPASGTDITAKFADANFLAEVRKALKKGESDEIYDTDVASIKNLSIFNKGIASLSGIEYFTALTALNCDGNQLSTLDVSKNTKLTELSCNSNQLSTLDMSKNTALTYLSCNSNQLSALNVSKNTELTVLDCSGNKLSALDVSNNIKLTALRCQTNQLTVLHVSNNSALTKLYCNYNQLTMLDVSNNTALTTLNCSSNYMANESAVNGLDTSRTTIFIFDPQKSSASTYAVTVNNGMASPSTAVAGATVTITANTPGNGKQFKEWTVVSGGVTLENSKESSTSFTMPANAVEVTATYEDIPAGVTQVTGVTLNKTDLSLYSNTSTKTANLTATITPADATDKSVTWQSSNTSVATVDESGLVTAVGNGTATITVKTTDGGYTASCTVTVKTYTSGGGSSSGGSSPANTATIKKNQPNQPITAVSSVTATVGTNGKASAPIPDKAVTDAISKAQEEATKQKKTENGISIGLNVRMPKGATTLTATLSQNALNSLVSAGVTNLEINGSPVTISFDKKALKEIQKQTNGNVSITIAPKTNLTETAKKMIGSRPVYNITVGHGNNDTVSSFGSGVATIAIPYTPANGEVISGLYAVYVDENGNATRVEGSAYDIDSGSVLFTTPHFSMYGVGYTAPSEKLTDISNHWAKESIDYVVDKGMIDGATETTFAPDTFMTRGTLVTALGRLTGKDVSSYTTSSFTDVEAGSTSQPYIEWAYEEGIIHGIGNDEFAPERAITREEIAVIIANFTKATGYTLPVVGEVTTYADASSIGDYYKTAVTAMQQAGIMTGGTDNKFNPKSNATRAEVSSMLHRYIKLIVD